ncbi:MAG: secretin N-terminal domain-containing protein [Planctomycetota bacterium]
MNEMTVSSNGRRAAGWNLCLLVLCCGLAFQPALGQEKEPQRDPQTSPPRAASPARPAEPRDAQDATPESDQPPPAMPRASQPNQPVPPGQPGDPAAQQAAQRKAEQSAERQAERAKKARIDELIKQVPPEQLDRLVGADISVEMVGDQIILQGPEEAVQLLELLIRGLDEAREAKDVRIVTVTERDAKEIARTVQQAIRDATKTPTKRPEDEVTITALSANVLLVAALPSEIEWIIDVIERVDAVPDPLGKIELMTFQIRYRKASEVAKELEKVINKLREAGGAGKEKEKLQIIPNNSNNTIAITARETERQKLQSIIDSMDVEPAKGFGEVRLTVFPLLHSKSEEMKKVIDDLLKAQASGERQAVEEVIQRLRITKASPSGELTELPPIDLQKPAKIIADGGTNSLIVATAESNTEPIGELIRLLDGVPLGADLAVRLFPLHFAAAEGIADTLKKMFDDGKKLPEDPDGSGKGSVSAETTGKALVYNVGIAADVRTNTLIVSGREEQISLVEQIVRQLDQPSTALKFPLRLIPLDYADASQLGKTITELFDKRVESAQAIGAKGAALEREKVFLSVDIRSNSLIVSASDENFDEITTISKQLDTRPAKLFEQIRIVHCARLSAADLKEKIDELWKRKADLRREAEMLEDLPILVADERSNSLVVASSMEDYDEISRLVATLDSQPLIESMQLFQLKYADAAVIRDMLDELFQGMQGQSEAFKAPTIIPDPRVNALIVAASRDSMERVEDVLKRLDVEAGPMTAIFKVYPLNHASSGQLSQRIQELFDSRAEGEKGARTPVVILAEDASNSLVVSASRDDHGVVVSLLELLDRPSTLAKHFKIFPLRLAKAPTVAEKLDSLFKSQGEKAGGRTDAIAIQPDERTNALVVWASPTQMVNIADVISRLDTAAPAVEMMVKVIQLKQALAEDFAKLLEDSIIGEQGGKEEQAVIVSFLEKAPDGKESLRKLLRQDIRIKPDTRTNSLMVMAPTDSMDMLESMIHDFDRIRPVTSEIRLFPLLNADAKTMVDRLSEVFDVKDGGGEGQGPRQELVFGDVSGEELATIGQQLRFAADTRTNTLIVAGAPVHLRMVEDMVRYLDSLEADDRITEVYQAKFQDTSKLAEAVKGFVEQEINVLGEGEDEESRMRRIERQISVESVGDPEKGSSNLLIGTSRRAYQRTMEMIQNLDRPEPQVMISVLIAEVTLTDNVDLGIEIAGQDLQFSEDAIVGPNGIIQGQDFDYVGGTSLGASNPLGFSFTITGEDFSFLFHALQGDNRLEVLSRPILLVRNGEEGNITIADKIPIVTGSQVTTGGNVNTTTGREDAGIILTATPHISPDGYVTIGLEQEISNVGESIQLSETVAQPIISERKVTTNVTVRDGETVVIGGLIQSRDGRSETKIPLLGDIPVLGALFRTTSDSTTKTELMVVLTVDILRTDEDRRRMSVEQRDKFILPDSIRRSPLLEGLRIKPEEEGLGPKPKPQPTEPTTAKPMPGLLPPPQPTPQEYGPRPRIYGPTIEKQTTTSTVSAPVYGPRIERTSDAAATP